MQAPSNHGDGQKRSHPRTNYASCLIYQKSLEQTLQRMTEQGYPSLLDAILKRDDDVAFRLQDDISDKPHFLSMNPLCHAKCRNAYTVMILRYFQLLRYSNPCSTTGCRPHRYARVLT